MWFLEPPKRLKPQSAAMPSKRADFPVPLSPTMIVTFLVRSRSREPPFKKDKLSGWRVQSAPSGMTDEMCRKKGGLREVLNGFGMDLSVGRMRTNTVHRLGDRYTLLHSAQRHERQK